MDFWELMLDILRAIAEIRTPVLDAIFSVVTKLGEETIALVLICLIYWCFNKELAYSAGFGYFFSSLFVQGAKITFRIDRPWILDPTFEPVEGALEHATSYSFPSGHTQSATGIFGGLAFNIKKTWVSFVCIAIALAVAFSRMYLGVHTLLDVGVSFITTLIIAGVVSAVFNKTEAAGIKRNVVIGTLLIAASVGVIIYGFTLYKNGIVAYDYASDCCKSAGAAMGFAVGFLVESSAVKFSVKSKNIWLHAVKLIVGMAVLLGLKSGLKILLGDTLVVDTLRYFLMIFWVMGIWPIFIKRFLQVKEEA